MKELIYNNKYPLIGAFIGLVVAILFINVGFFKTILVFILVFMGTYLGFFARKIIKNNN